MLTRARLLSSYLACLALVTGPAWAVRIDAVVGFDGQARAGVWTPISVSLSNPGDENLEGRLELEQSDHSQHSFITAPQIELPARSRKLYHAYCRLASYGEVTLKLVDKSGDLVAKQKLKATVVTDSQVTVVTIGPRAARLSFLSGETTVVGSVSGVMATGPMSGGGGPVSSSRTGIPITATFMESAYLPERPAGYAGVDVIVIADLTPSAADPAVLKAISMWVAGGGTLVVTVGADYRRYVNDFYDELLPVTLTGAGSVPASALGVLGKSPPDGVLAIAKSVPKPGAVVNALAGGLPLYASRRYGEGKVVYLAFDHQEKPFAGWSGQTIFWRKLATDAAIMRPQASQHGNGAPPPVMSQDLANVVQDNPSIRTPSLGLIWIFLLAYLLVLSPINYLVLRRMRKLEFAWATTPIIVAVFAVAAYAIGFSLKGGNILLTQATLIRASCDARYASAQTNAWIFSPARRTYRLAVSDPVAVTSVVPSFSRYDGEPEYTKAMPTFYLGETTKIENAQMAMWSSEAFVSQTGVDLGGHLRSNLVNTGTAVSGTITNNTGYDLVGCQVVFDHAAADLGVIKRGATTTLQLAYMPPITSPVPSKLLRSSVGYNSGAKGSALPGSVSKHKPKKASLRESLFNYAKVSGQGQPVLLASFGGSVERFIVQGEHPRVKSATCLMVDLPCRTIGTLMIEPSMMRVSIDARDTNNILHNINRKQGVISGTIYGVLSFITYFDAPSAVGTRVVSLIPIVNVGSADSVGTVELMISEIGSGKWVAIKPNKQLKNPSRYVDNNGRVTLLATTKGAKVRFEMSLRIVCEAR